MATEPRVTALIVAGGLTPENVGTAISAFAPDITDVSSGVESAPGVKDHKLMKAFAEAVHSASIV
jgi:phosphoribosylanthranilate isomerase